MKTVYQWAAVAFVATLAACSSDEQPINDGTIPMEDNRVKVELGTRAPLSMETKSAIDVVEYGNWVGQQVAVWGLASDISWTAEGSRLFGTDVYALATVGAETNAVYPLEFDVTYYYPVDGSKPFDFFAYAPVDGASATLRDAALNVNFDLTGAEDVIAATAIGPKDVNGTGVNGYSGAYFREEGATKPNLTFRHLLSRLKFEVFAGDQQTTFEENAVYVTGVKVTGVQTAATLVMTAEATSLTGIGEATGEMVLTDKDLDTLADVQATVTKASGQDGSRIGESLLVLPGMTTVNMVVTLRCMQDGELTEPVDREASFSVSGGLAQGTQYRVKLVVYGLTKVEATASIEPWVDGDDVDVAPLN